MNRRDFSKTAGLVAAAAVVAPKIMAEDSASKSEFFDYYEKLNGSVRVYYDADVEPGYDYVIGIYAGGGLNEPAFVSVWRKGQDGTPLVQAVEYEYRGPASANGWLLNDCVALGKKFGKYLPNGPLFSIEQIVSSGGDLLLYQLKYEGFLRHHKTKAYRRPKGEPKEGWYSTSWSKPIAIERFLTAYKEKNIVANSGLLRKDIAGAEWDGKKLLLPSGNDNRFMAAAIAVNSFLETDQEV